MKATVYVCWSCRDVWDYLPTSEGICPWCSDVLANVDEDDVPSDFYG